MRELIASLLTGALSRRGFRRAMSTHGFSNTVAQEILASVDSLQLDESDVTPFSGTPLRSGGELLLIQLTEAGIQYVFTNPDATQAGLLDALLNTSTLSLVMALNEDIAIAMADGYARTTGKPSVVLLHPTSGSVTMAAQLYNACVSQSPLIVIQITTTPVPVPVDLPPAELTDSHPKQSDLYFPSLLIQNVTDLPKILYQAYRIACLPPGGPVRVTLSPALLLSQPVAVQVINRRRFNGTVSFHPDVTAVEQLAQILVDARKPVVFFDPQLEYSGAVETAVELVNTIGLRVMEGVPFWAGTSDFPTDHSAYHHPCSWTADRTVLDGFDLHLAVGGLQALPRPEMLDPLGTHPPADATRRAVISPVLAPSLPVPSPYLFAPVAPALEDLLVAVQAVSPKSRLAGARSVRGVAAMKDKDALKYLATVETHANRDQHPMHPDEVGILIDRALDPDALIVSENTSHDNYCLFNVLTRYGQGAKRRLVARSGMLGWGIGAAIGAKLAAPHQQVVLQIGDGAMLYNPAGLWTLARYPFPVLVIVWNNESYQSIRLAYSRYVKRITETDCYAGTFIGKPAVDFVKLGESQGISGTGAENPQQLSEALKNGMNRVRDGLPFLISVTVRGIGSGALSTWAEKLHIASTRDRQP